MSHAHETMSSTMTENELHIESGSLFVIAPRLLDLNWIGRKELPRAH
jgi:hypothetical protein